jgi:hypothetical protein
MRSGLRFEAAPWHCAGSRINCSTKRSKVTFAYIHELINRLDGKAVQAVDYGEVPVEKMTDAQLYAILARGLPDSDCQPKALPAPGKV